MLFTHPAGKAALFRIRQVGPNVSTSNIFGLQAGDEGAISGGREMRQMPGRFSPNDAKHGKEGIR
jgi:hypothetical protein